MTRPMRNTVLAFVRYERADLETLGVLQLRTSIPTDVEVKAALVAATTHWVNTTEAGRALWEYSCADVNAPATKRLSAL